MIQMLNQPQTSDYSIRSFGPFQQLDQKAIDRFLDNRQQRAYKQHETLFREGEKSEGVYCLHSGIVKLLKHHEKGPTLLCHLSLPGEIPGLPSLWNQTGTHTISARVLEPVRATFIAQDDLYALTQSSPTFATPLLQAMSQHLETIEQNMAELSRRQPFQRLARVLLLLGSRFDPIPDGTIELRLPHWEIARFARISQESLTAFLHQLEEQQIVTYSSYSLRIQNLAQLEQLSLLGN